MSDHLQGIGIENGAGDVVVAQALAQAVRAAGRDLATEPRRVQGMVSDVLGADARTRRAEIDAVVLAAEESIPEDLLADRIDVDAALDRLHERGLDEGVAMFAVEVWRYALGMLAADAQPPSLRNSLDMSSRPAVTDPAPVSLTDPIAIPVTDFTTATDTNTTSDISTTNSDASGLVDATDTDDSNRHTTQWLLGIAAVVAALCLGLVGAAIWLARDGGSSDAEAVTVTTPLTAAPTTAAAPATAIEVTFDAEPTPLGELTRSWSVEDAVLTATLAFENTTEAATTDRYYEVVPKSLAATADLITSEHEYSVIKNDPVIAWDLTIEPGATVEVGYVVALTGDVTSDTLEAMKTEQLAQAAAFVVERNTAPTLTFTTPNDQTVASDVVTVSGMTDPTATVTFIGTPILVNPDGTWSMTGNLPPGPNTLTFVATSTYRVTTQADFRINVELPATVDPVDPPPTTTRPGVTPPTGTPPVVTPPAVTPPVVTPPIGTAPQPPIVTPPETAPPPPVVTVALSGPSSANACEARVTFTASVSGATSGTWRGSWGYSEAASAQSLSFVPRDNANAYTLWVEYTANGPGGSATDRRSMTVNPDPRVDYVRSPAECDSVGG